METLYLRPARPRSIPIEQTWGLNIKKWLQSRKSDPAL